MSKIIDADKIEYGYLWKKKDGTAHSPAFAFKEDIMKQPELPTMKSNNVCDYCSVTKCDRHTGIIPFCFRGKKIIEVSE